MATDPLKTLMKKVLTDVGNTGFATELRVSALLESLNWKTNHSVYFLDEDEQKGREVDISAYTSVQNTKDKPEVTTWCMLSLEIKQSKSKPWVIFTSKRESVEVGGYNLLIFRHNNPTPSLGEIEQYRPGANHERIGRQTYRALAKNDTSTISSAIISAVKAAIFDHKNCVEIYSDSSKDMVFFVPVVVVDGDLFECWIDESNELKIKTVKYMPYRQRYLSPSYGKGDYQVDIVTVNGLEQYLNQQKMWLESIFQAIESKVRS